jgi:hypothetical protein
MTKYLIFIVGIALLFLSCGKPCKEVTYQFFMREAFIPERDSIHVGDTIYLESVHATTFTDSLNGNNTQINFSNSLLGSNLRVLQFPDTSTFVIGAIPDFNIAALNGMASGNDNIPSENKGFYYQEINSQYILRLQFIALKKGIYSISLGNSIGVIKGGQDCEKASFEIENSNVNNHLYFYQNWRPGYIINSYERTHMYCFKVY